MPDIKDRAPFCEGTRYRLGANSDARDRDGRTHARGASTSLNCRHAFDMLVVLPPTSRPWARSMCDGIPVGVGRWLGRNERSSTTLTHESGRAQRLADFFDDRVTDSLMQGSPAIAHLILAVAVEMARKRGLSDLTAGRQRLTSWTSFDAKDGPAAIGLLLVT